MGINQHNEESHQHGWEKKWRLKAEEGKVDKGKSGDLLKTEVGT